MIMFEAGPTTVGVQIDADSIKTGEDVNTLIGLLATRLHLHYTVLHETVQDLCRQEWKEIN